MNMHFDRESDVFFRTETEAVSAAGCSCAIAEYQDGYLFINHRGTCFGKNGQVEWWNHQSSLKTPTPPHFSLGQWWNTSKGMRYLVVEIDELGGRVALRAGGYGRKKWRPKDVPKRWVLEAYPVSLNRH